MRRMRPPPPCAGPPPPALHWHGHQLIHRARMCEAGRPALCGGRGRPPPAASASAPGRRRPRRVQNKGARAEPRPGDPGGAAGTDLNRRQARLDTGLPSRRALSAVGPARETAPWPSVPGGGLPLRAGTRPPSPTSGRTLACRAARGQLAAPAQVPSAHRSAQAAGAGRAALLRRWLPDGAAQAPRPPSLHDWRLPPSLHDCPRPASRANPVGPPPPTPRAAAAAAAAARADAAAEAVRARRAALGTRRPPGPAPTAECRNLAALADVVARSPEKHPGAAGNCPARTGPSANSSVPVAGWPPC